MTHLLIAGWLTILQAATPAPASLAGGVQDVATLAAATTNEQRFDALTAMLRARNLPFTIESVTLEKPRGAEPRSEGRNVIVTFGNGAEEVLLGAHYDAARLQDTSLSKGAVDNAASSVILVRLAEALRGDALPFRIRIVWFDMEELGLVGSSQYVSKHGPAGITAMINLDVNGYGDTVLFGPSARTDNAALRRAVVQTCAAEDVPCVGYPQMPPSDDRPFVAAGVPTVSLAMLPALEAHQLWLMMNGGPTSGLAKDASPVIMRTIHTPDDVPSRVDEKAMATVLRFSLALVRGLARR